MHVGCFNNVLFACFDCFDFSFVYTLFGESFGCFAKVGLRLNEAAGRLLAWLLTALSLIQCKHLKCIEIIFFKNRGAFSWSETQAGSLPGC